MGEGFHATLTAKVGQYAPPDDAALPEKGLTSQTEPPAFAAPGFAAPTFAVPVQSTRSAAGRLAANDPSAPPTQPGIGSSPNRIEVGVRAGALNGSLNDVPSNVSNNVPSVNLYAVPIDAFGTVAVQEGDYELTSLPVSLASTAALQAVVARPARLPDSGLYQVSLQGGAEGATQGAVQGAAQGATEGATEGAAAAGRGPIGGKAVPAKASPIGGTQQIGLAAGTTLPNAFTTFVWQPSPAPPDASIQPTAMSPLSRGSVAAILNRSEIGGASVPAAPSTPVAAFPPISEKAMGLRPNAVSAEAPIGSDERLGSTQRTAIGAPSGEVGTQYLSRGVRRTPFATSGAVSSSSDVQPGADTSVPRRFMEGAAIGPVSTTGGNVHPEARLPFVMSEMQPLGLPIPVAVSSQSPVSADTKAGRPKPTSVSTDSKAASLAVNANKGATGAAADGSNVSTAVVPIATSAVRWPSSQVASEVVPGAYRSVVATAPSTGNASTSGTHFGGATAASPSAPASVDLPVAEPHRTLLATPTALEVGVQSGTQGWVRIRAEVGGDGQVSASLAANTAGGRESLHNQLPALNAFLHGEAVPVTASLAAGVGTRGEVSSDGSARLQMGAGGHTGTGGSDASSGAFPHGSENRRESAGNADAIEVGYRSEGPAVGGIAQKVAMSSGIQAGHPPESGHWLSVHV